MLTGISSSTRCVHAWCPIPPTIPRRQSRVQLSNEWPHGLYPALGDRAETRQAAYRKQFRDMLWAELIADLGHATNGNIARFQAQAAAQLGRRVTPGKPGRPRLVEAPASGDLFAAGSD